MSKCEANKSLEWTMETGSSSSPLSLVCLAYVLYLFLQFKDLPKHVRYHLTDKSNHDWWLQPTISNFQPSRVWKGPNRTHVRCTTLWFAEVTEMPKIKTTCELFWKKKMVSKMLTLEASIQQMSLLENCSLKSIEFLNSIYHDIFRNIIYFLTVK